jgi:hypothetical protein
LRNYIKDQLKLSNLEEEGNLKANWNKFGNYLTSNGRSNAVDLVDSAKKIVESTPDRFRIQLLYLIFGSMNDPKFAGELFSLDGGEKKYAIRSETMKKIARVYGGDGSSQIGYGEFALALLLEGGTWNGLNALEDVSGGGKKWHVKKIDKTSVTTRMGLADWTSTETFKKLQEKNVFGDQPIPFSIGQATVVNNLEKISRAFDDTNLGDGLTNFQNSLNEDLRSRHFKGASLAVFDPGDDSFNLITDVSKIYCAGVTQSRLQLTLVPNWLIKAALTKVAGLEKQLKFDFAKPEKKPEQV